jgi:hypothetical protein
MARRRIHEDDEFTMEDEDRKNVEFDEAVRYDEPSEDIQGEPWGWTKPGPRPRGWREDGDYPGHNQDDPGPFDGEWEER